MATGTPSPTLVTGTITTSPLIINFAKPQLYTEFFFMVYGTYSGLTFAFNGSYDGVNYIPVKAEEIDTVGAITGNISPSTNQSVGWRIVCENMCAIQVSVSAFSTGTANYIQDNQNFNPTPEIIYGAGAQTINGTLTIADGQNIVVGSTTGTQIATATTQKIGFYGATPIVQPANTVDYVTMLTNLGLRATGGTATATFPGSVSMVNITATGTVALTNNMTITDAKNIILNTTTGTKIGTATTQKLGFFNSAPVVQPVAGGGNTSTGAAGSVTNVFLNTTFVGNTGSGAYTVADIVSALKAVGLIAA